MADEPNEVIEKLLEQIKELQEENFHLQSQKEKKERHIKDLEEEDDKRYILLEEKEENIKKLKREDDKKTKRIKNLEEEVEEQQEEMRKLAAQAAAAAAVRGAPKSDRWSVSGASLSSQSSRRSSFGSLVQKPEPPTKTYPNILHLVATAVDHHMRVSEKKRDSGISGSIGSMEADDLEHVRSNGWAQQQSLYDELAELEQQQNNNDGTNNKNVNKNNNNNNGAISISSPHPSPSASDDDVVAPVALPSSPSVPPASFRRRPMVLLLCSFGFILLLFLFVLIPSIRYGTLVIRLPPIPCRAMWLRDRVTVAPDGYPSPYR